MNKLTIIPAFIALAVLASCKSEPEKDSAPEPEPTASASPHRDEPVSILRPDVAPPELPEAPLDPLKAVIGFPNGGAELSDGAIASLKEIMGSDQFALGLPIVLRGHSDSAGSDAANIRASAARAEAVRDWLIANGVAEDRIMVIAFGEQNPAQPNALADGSPNEAGRAANRRVEVEVPVIAAPPKPAEAAGEPATD